MLATDHKAAGARLCRALALTWAPCPAYAFDSPLRSTAWALMSDLARVAAVIGCALIPAIVLGLHAAGGAGAAEVGVVTLP